MNLAQIKEAIRVAVRDALGFSDTQEDGRPSLAIVWRDTHEAGAYRPDVRADLSTRSIAALGSDEERYEFDEDEDTNTPTLCGNRMIPVQLRIESPYQTPGTTLGAEALGARFLVRIGRQSILAALRVAGVALNSIGLVVNTDYTRDGRRLAVYICEVLFSAAENDLDTTPEAGDYVARVTVEADTLDSDHASYGINLVIPPE